MVFVTLEAETPELLQEKIDSYLRNYHPYGYGTLVKSVDGSEIQKSEKNSGYFAAITRYSSCD